MEQSCLLVGTFAFGLFLGYLLFKPQVVEATVVSPQKPARKIRKKKKKVQPHPKAIEEAPSLAEEHSVSSVEVKVGRVQEEELQNLEAIFMDDLKVLRYPSQEATGHFQLFLKPFPDLDSTVLCTVYLEVEYTPGYPSQAPIITLKNAVNLTKDQVSEIEKTAISRAEYKAKYDFPVIFEICQMIQEALTGLNQPQAILDVSAQKTEEAKIRKWSQGDQSTIIHETSQIATLNDNIDMKRITEQLDDYDQNFARCISVSKFKDEYEEVERIGKGAGGSVYKARHKLDGVIYAIKKVKLNRKKPSRNVSLLREVTLLSRLQHEHIVRYCHAWKEENSDSESEEDEDEWSEEESDSRSGSNLSGDSAYSDDSEVNDRLYVSFDEDDSDMSSYLAIKSDMRTNEANEYLYIKMEYCEGLNLGQVLEKELPPVGERWRLLREIIEGLGYIHSKGLIHRDLKPNNIFLREGTVKLGDFGLATTLFQPKQDKFKDDSKNDTESLSRGVGTIFYRAPEQDKGDKYDQKADTFSLGVILFEMWREFGSRMQRADELTKLTTRHELPADFVKETPAVVVELILHLTSQIPSERPSPADLLNNETIFNRVESIHFNEFMSCVMDPKSLESNRLLAKFFERPNPSTLKYGLTEGQVADSTVRQLRRQIKQEAMLKSGIISKVKDIFGIAGGVEISTPLVNLNFQTITIFTHQHGKVTPVRLPASETCAKFIEPSGLIVRLPGNLEMPWARHLAEQNYGGVLKRFVVGNVYKENSPGVQPKEQLEACFDICFNEEFFPENRSILEAELLRIAYDTIQSISGHFNVPPLLTISISDSRILDGILDYCAVPMEIRLEVLKIMYHLERRKWASCKQDLVDKGLAPASCEKLAHYFKIKGSLPSVIEQLKRLPNRPDEQFLSILEVDLKALFEASELFSLEKFEVDFGIVPENFLYYSGLLFKISAEHVVEGVRRIKAKTVFAVGGRYDNLIRNFEAADKSQHMAAVGVRIFLERFISLAGSSIEVDRVISGPVVFIASHSRTLDDSPRMLQERIRLTCLFWKENISCLYMYDQIELAEIQDLCNRYRIRFLVILRAEGDTEIAYRVKDFAYREQMREEADIVEFVNARLEASKRKKVVLKYFQQKAKHLIKGQ